jgi:pilus assembly protein CpaB
MSRLSPGTVIVAIFAVLFGLVGAYAVRKSMQTPEKETPEPRTSIVPVASIDLEPGRRLTLGDVALLRLTDEQIIEKGYPEGYMTNPQQIIGRTLRDPSKQGEVFLTQQFYPEGLGPSIAERLKPGFRAVTVPIAAIGAVSGMATPGSFVDVIFRNAPSPGENLPATTITLLESVEVLAIGRDAVPGSVPPSSVQQVTLAVTPEQAAALNVVENRGQLALSLRSPRDQEYISNPIPQTLHKLLGIQEPTPTISTEIYRRGALSTKSFSSGPAPMSQVTAMPIRAPRTAPESQTVSTPAPVEPVPAATDSQPITDTIEATEVDPFAPAAEESPAEPQTEQVSPVENATEASATLAPPATPAAPATSAEAAPAPTPVTTPAQPLLNSAAKTPVESNVPELKAFPEATKTLPIPSAIPVAPPTHPTAILNPPVAQPVPSSAVPASESQASRLRTPSTTREVPSLLNRQTTALAPSKIESKFAVPTIEKAERSAIDRRVSRALSPVTRQPNRVTAPAVGSSNVD